jgi:hypothetical protein
MTLYYKIKGTMRHPQLSADLPSGVIRGSLLTSFIDSHGGTLTEVSS